MDHFDLRPAPVHLCDAEKKLWDLRELGRVKQCKARLRKNLKKNAGSLLAQQSQNAGAALAPASQQPAVMGCVATRHLTTKGDYAQVDVAQYTRLKERHSAYQSAISEWVASFHGADVERIRAGREKGLEAGHQLRKEIEAFACHAALETEKRIKVEELGRALLDKDVAVLERELQRRHLPVAVEEALPTQLRSRHLPRRQEQQPPPSPAQWDYAQYRTELGGPGFNFSPSFSTPPPYPKERNATKRTSVYGRIQPPLDRSSRNSDQSRQERRSPSAKRRTESPGVVTRPAKAPTPKPSGPDPTQRQQTRPARPVGVKEKPKSLPPLPSSAHLFSPPKEVPKENAARPPSPVQGPGPSKEVEEMLLRSPVVPMEEQETANSSRPPTPDIVHAGTSDMEVDGQPEANGHTQELQEPEGIDGITIHEKDLIAYSPAKEGATTPPTVVEKRKASSTTPEAEVDPSSRSHQDDDGRGRRHSQKASRRSRRAERATSRSRQPEEKEEEEKQKDKPKEKRKKEKK